VSFTGDGVSLPRRDSRKFLRSGEPSACGIGAGDNLIGAWGDRLYEMGSISGSGVVCRLDRGEDVAVPQILEFWTTGTAILDDGAVSGVFLGLAKERDRRSRADASRRISSGSSNQNGFAFGPCTPRMLLLEVVRRESLDSVACILWLLESAPSWSPCSLTSSAFGRSAVGMEFLTVDAGC